MSLHEYLMNCVQTELLRIPQAKLVLAGQELSQRYRSPQRDACGMFMTSDAHRLAYLAIRLPATFAVVQRVLQEIKKRLPGWQAHSLLDVGAGPGTATWAAAVEFPELQAATLLEQEADWLAVGKRMMLNAPREVLKEAAWHQRAQLKSSEFANFDLVVMSYMVGEIPSEALPQLISEGWQATNQLLVVIEPGTPHGFERIRQVRQQLIDSGAHLVAPCPHAGRCPMEKGDWCHFAERLERPSFHMAIKDVTLGYEDEKYSYIVAAKRPVLLPEARILRHPQRHSGHIGLTLCAQSGLEQRVISRRHGALYKQAKKLEWGDTFPPDQKQED